MTNYMGKARLIKLFYHYISERTEYVKSFKAAVKEYGKETMFCYKKYRGSEWLEVHHEGFEFNFYISGQSTKTIAFDEFKYNCESDERELLSKIRIISNYSEDFYPYPHNEDKSLDCYSIAKAASANAETTIIYQSEDGTHFSFQKIHNDGRSDITAKCKELKIALPDGFFVFSDEFGSKSIRYKNSTNKYSIMQNCIGEPYLYGGKNIHSAKITVLEEINCDDDVIYLDTETTGLNADIDEILQISIVNNNGDILLDSYIRPERNTEWEAAEEIHHISYDMVKDAPLASDIAPKIFEIIANAKVVIAYNISFDWKFILRILENNGYNLDEKTPELKCCMEKFAEVYGEWDEYRQCYRWQKLSTAANYYYPKVKWRGKAHGSLADTLMCRDVWNEMNRD